MRLATFNLESLDLGPKAQVALETRAAVLRPALERVAADILCLQEVNGQHLARRAERQLIALERFLEGTPYQHYARAQMLDHILASRSLYGHFRRIEVHNEGLGDEALGYGKAIHSAASYHAPVVAEFKMGDMD